MKELIKYNHKRTSYFKKNQSAGLKVISSRMKVNFEAGVGMVHQNTCTCGATGHANNKKYSI